MNRLSPRQAGITLGALFAIMHGTWLVIVAAGFGDTAVTFLTGAHFVTVEHTVTAPDLVTMVLGIPGAFVSGFVIGGLFALLWNAADDRL